MTDPLDHKEYLLNSLRSLGSTPRDVAKTLEELGIKGDLQNPHTCPVSRFVKALPEPWIRGVITTGCSGVTIYSEDDLETGLRIRFPNPVRDFVEMFDVGTFPELVEGGLYA